MARDNRVRFTVTLGSGNCPDILTSPLLPTPDRCTNSPGARTLEDEYEGCDTGSRDFRDRGGAEDILPEVRARETMSGQCSRGVSSSKHQKVCAVGGKGSLGSAPQCCGPRGGVLASRPSMPCPTRLRLF